MPILVILLALSSFAWPSAQAAAPRISAVVNAASGQSAVAPGALISIYGTDLASTTLSAGSIPLPRTLGGTRVTVDGVDMPVLAVSPGQVNAQLPFEVSVAAGSRKTVKVVVVAASGSSPEVGVTVLPTAPAVFTTAMSGSGPAILLNPDFTYATSVLPDHYYVFYAGGLGTTNPAGRTGEGGSAADPFQRPVVQPDVFIGEQKMDVAFAALTPWPGVYQVNIHVPAGVSLYSDRMWVQSQGWSSNVTGAPVAGRDTPGVTGSITDYFGGQSGLSGQTLRADFTPFPVQAKFSLKIEVPVGGAHYQVAAIAEGASALLELTPQGVLTAVNTGPGSAARLGDFSLQPSAILDFMSCTSGGGCNQVPNNMIPTSRLAPWIVRGWQEFPQVNLASGSAVGTFTAQAAGPGAAGGTLLIDDAHKASMSLFGGFLMLSGGPARTDTLHFRLYVNGKLIASKDVPFSIMGY